MHSLDVRHDPEGSRFVVDLPDGQAVLLFDTTESRKRLMFYVE